jgi:hypothetical protein
MVMSGSSTTILPFSSSGDPGCFAGTLSAPQPGVTATVVIARGVGICRQSTSTCMGVVFYGASAAMWTCLSDDELARFQTWSQSTFPGAQILKVTAVRSAIICPPPSMVADAHTTDETAEVQRELTRLGQTWLAQAARAVPAA